jgi:hypothetical protein
VAAATAGPSLRERLAEELTKSGDVSRKQRQRAQQRHVPGPVSSEQQAGPSLSSFGDDPVPDKVGSALGSDAADGPSSAPSVGDGQGGDGINADNWRHIVEDLFPSVRDR